ncbi:hypothetical protein STSP2_01135 [Anaerohalosphaera lusitana]|uniref:Uncharacterized protein n=1 Tax=Anaerohalosphaera lusitana TaxID=1936003 RepID=A0A1U9NJ87_9BACT|nr:hypothetical protein [Anaerohalosphaera lusitana]AQT67981.1 hypothetical protein STSP2_01135 [Anaerohalosphaera lusitana]
MKRFKWQIFLGVGLVGMSAVLYFVHYLMFHDAHHIFIYLMGDIAFVPIEVLMVTLILHELLASRDRRNKMNKLNMVIGTFFSEVGTELLRFLASHDSNSDMLGEVLDVEGNWTKAEFGSARNDLQGHDFKLSVERNELSEIAEMLVGKRGFMVTLLENPLLLEHDRFTDTLWAVFHLTEELASRRDFSTLSDKDLAHLTGDMERAYSQAAVEWIHYMEHLKSEYPYLFSLAMRRNPFGSSEDAAM